MPERLFTFKQFSISHSRSAMKIGTDGVLLGAWAKLPEMGSFLDIGCGSGLISLMLAQRSHQMITAVEIDADAYSEAVENVCNSAWKHRINVLHGDIRKILLMKRYSLIVCNPPFFSGSNSPDLKRNTARHDEALSPSDLFGVVAVLSRNGAFYVIYPYNRREEILAEAARHQLFCSSILYVKPRADVEPVRSIFCFSFQQQETESSELIIETKQRHHYTDEYKKLTADFYLKF